METCTYEIGGKMFYQRPLGALQESLVEDLIFTEFTKVGGVKDLPSFLKILGPRKPQLMAIVLIPDGQVIKQFVKALQRHDYLPTQAEWFSNESSPGVRMKVVSDFFVCNDIALYAEGMIDLVQAVTAMAKKVEGFQHANGSNNSAPFLQEATHETEPVSMP